MHIKNIMRQHLTFTIMSIIKNSDNNKSYRGLKKLEASHTGNGNIKCSNAIEKQPGSFSKM